MSALAVAYGELLKKSRPAVIHNEEDNRACIETLEHLVSKGNLSPAEGKLAELLTVLIENFEAHQYEMEESGPLDVIRHLIEVNGLRQRDLVDVFGTESIVSEVLNGKRDLTKDHILRLSARFAVSPVVFF